MPSPETHNPEDALSNVGELLVADGSITQQQLAKAERVLARLEVKERLSDVLLKLGYVGEPQLRAVMKKHKRSLSIGDFLVEMRFVSESDLRKATQLQATEKKRLGEILVENGMISEVNLCKALGEKFDCPVIEPDLRLVDKRLLRKTSERFLKKHTMIPFSESPEGVVVIFADPMDKAALEGAREAFGREIQPAMATRESILQAIESMEEHPEAEEPRAEAAEDKENIIRIVEAIIRAAIDNEVSDIHVEPMRKKLRIRYRKDGVLIQKTDFPKHLQDAITSRIKVMAGADIADRRRHQDGKINYDYYNNKVDIRMSSYVSVFGETIVMRLLSQKKGLKELSELGFPPQTLTRYIHEVLEPPSGVVIITGPTGSGKTTTLYSSIDYCNDPSVKIITAEDPVEYVIEGIIQCSIKPEIGLTFDETLRSIVRQDPDIVVLGEIRDKLSAEVAIQAALTGHKVFSTFHTEDSVGGIMRLMDMDIETFLISSTVLSIVAQRLLRKVCSFCREAYSPDPVELGRIGVNSQEVKGHPFFRGAGCAHCHYTGYQGRLGIYELLVLNEGVRDAILTKSTAYAIRKISLAETGLTTLLEDGIGKALQGITTVEEVRKHLPYTAKPRPVPEILALMEE